MKVFFGKSTMSVLTNQHWAKISDFGKRFFIMNLCLFRKISQRNSLELPIDFYNQYFYHNLSFSAFIIIFFCLSGHTCHSN